MDVEDTTTFDESWTNPNKPLYRNSPGDNDRRILTIILILTVTLTVVIVSGGGLCPGDDCPEVLVQCSTFSGNVRRVTASG